MNRMAAPTSGTATPKMIGSVKVEELVGFSHGCGPQVESGEVEVVLSAARGTKWAREDWTFQMEAIRDSTRFEVRFEAAE